MAKRLHRKDAPARGIARVFAHQVESALRALSRTAPADRDVHDLRKRLKEARASLRLLRGDVGRKAYHRMNRGLRDAGRPFTRVRDAKVLLERFEAIAPALRAHPDVVTEVKRYLASQRRGARREALGDREVRGARTRVRRVREHAAKTSRTSGGWPVVAAGLLRVYVSAREAHHEARLHDTVETLHEWRKQTKYLRHGLEVLLPRVTDGASRPVTARSPRTRQTRGRGRKGGELAAQAHQLTDLLGEDHDLAVLGASLVTGRMGGGLQERAVRLLEPRIVSRRARLQGRAFSLGRRFFARSPAAFERAVHAQWRRWRDG